MKSRAINVLAPQIVEEELQEVWSTDGFHNYTLAALCRETNTFSANVADFLGIIIFST